MRDFLSFLLRTYHDDDDDKTTLISCLNDVLVWNDDLLEHPTAWIQRVENIVVVLLGILSAFIWYLQQQQRQRRYGGGGGGGGGGPIVLSSSHAQSHRKNIVLGGGAHRRRRRRQRLDSGGSNGYMGGSFEDIHVSSGTMTSAARLRSHYSRGHSGDSFLAFDPEQRPITFLSATASSSLGWTTLDEWEQHQERTADLISVARPEDEFLDRAAGRSTMIRTFVEMQGETRYEGPMIAVAVYQTWAPPPTWAGVARHLLHVVPLQRTLRLDFSKQPVMLSSTANRVHHEEEEKRDHQKNGKDKEKHARVQFSVALTDVSVHPQLPVEAGVLELYTKDSPRSEWLEQTFESAQMAAQFQTDLLAAQLLGPSIHHMYQVLELLHRGSLAFPGEEFVLHDTTWTNSDKPPITGGGVAWGDVFRSLGCNIPVIRARLHTLLWARFAQNNEGSKMDANGTAEKGGEDSTPMIADYIGKRILLGPVDFFRLFVPLLPDDATPHAQASVQRMERFLRWRKLCARASVLVHAYAMARKIANRGWKLTKAVTDGSTTTTVRTLPDGYWKCRLSYDEPADNFLHDASAKEEFYEGIVSRTVLCQVRDVGFWDKQPWWTLGFRQKPTTLSLGQAYTLVDTHVVRLPTRNQNSVLDPRRDPVEYIPSLKKLIASHPENEFFITAHFLPFRGIVSIMLFVQSLPRGVDSTFDCVVDRFKAGNAEFRDKKLECMFQITVGNKGLTWFAFISLKIFQFVIWMLQGRRHVSQAAATKSDRYSLPPVRLVELGETHHFGGAVERKISDFPKNYVACTLFMDSRASSTNTLASRILISYLEKESMASDVFDVTIKLAGEHDDELPERALGTCRFVHCNPRPYALPPSYAVSSSAAFHGIDDFDEALELKGFDPGQSVGLYLRIFLADPLVAATKSFTRTVVGLDENDSPISRYGQRFFSLSPVQLDSARVSALDTRDPAEKAIDELIAILEDVMVPVRREQIQYTAGMEDVSDTSLSGSAANIVLSQTKHHRSDLVQLPLLQRVTRNDIHRFFVASGNNMKKAAVRIVESAAWRGLTFPIDVRMCRLELQNGQFFQQGRDSRGNPVFYFRNRILGLWRKNEDALIAAVLHRLEASLQLLERTEPGVRFTVIVVMGKPSQRANGSIGKADDLNEQVDDDGQASDNDRGSSADSEVSAYEHDDEEEDGGTLVNEDFYMINNPRIPAHESFHQHTNHRTIHRLVDLLTTHYPERLNRALVVMRHGNKSYARFPVGGRAALRQFVKSSKTREKVRFLTKYKDLQRYVARDQLVSLVGGTTPIDSAAFEC